MRGSGPIVNIFSSLSPPEQEEPQHYEYNIDLVQSIFSPYKKEEVWCLSVIQSKYLSETTKAWLTHEVSLSPTSCLPLAAASLVEDCVTTDCHLLVKRNKTIGCVNLPHSTLIYYSV